MKSRGIFTGLTFLFFGILLLLRNFHLIEFHFRGVFQLWPLFLIYTGINIILSYYEKLNKNIFTVKLIVFLAFCGLVLFQITGLGNINNDYDFLKIENKDSDDEDSTQIERSMVISATDSAFQKQEQILELSGGGLSYKVLGSTPDLIVINAVSKEKNNSFSLDKNILDSTSNIIFKNNNDRNKKGNLNLNNSNDHANIKLNASKTWSFVVNAGVSNLDLNLMDFKVRKFNFDGGVSSLNLKLGDQMEASYVTISSGVADININIPKLSGCQIKSKSGLSVQDFDGFAKVKDDIYETDNFGTAKNKIYIELSGGLNSFDVNRY